MDDFFNGSASGSIVDVRAFFDSGIPELIAELVEMGILVSVGTTRDRGAVSLTVTSDGRHRREYFRRADEAADFLRAAAAATRGVGVGDPGRDRPVVRKPSRGARKAV